MHPDTRFRWTDEAAMRAFVSARGFAHVAGALDGAVRLAHAPLAFAADGTARFHVARANALAALPDGAPLVASISADDAYVSPDWYAAPTDQVPTWNYRAVEIHGRARRLDEAELRDQLDRLAAAQEARLAPKRPWTSAKVARPKLEAMLRAITGYAIEAAVLIGTAKYGQNKPAADRAGAAAGLRAAGAHAAADATAGAAA